jgi:hypothetical protein
MFSNFKKRLIDAPKPLVWTFGLIMLISVVLGALTFSVPTLIRWVITFSLMYAVLGGDRTWASVLAGLSVIGAFFTIIMFWSKSPIVAVVFALLGLGIAYYLMLSKEMKVFFARKKELQEIVK